MCWTRKSEDLIASVNQFVREAVALEDDVRRIELVLTIKTAIREGK